MAVMQYSCLCYNYIKEDEKKAKRYKNSIKKIQKREVLCMKKRNLNKIKQMVSIGMSCIMAGSTCNLPMMLHAEEVQTENMHPTYMVTSFDELNEEIAYQALSIGAEESEINFPDTLKVKVIRQVEEEPSTEADESVGEGNGAEDSQEGEEWTIEHITWKLDAEKSSLPEFDSSEESAGAVYIYTPNIPETDENGNHYILSEEAILPEIYVMVDCVDNGIVLYSSNIVASGTCGAEGNNGDNLTWILDDEGVLTISGTGAMASWENDSPWHENQDIKSGGHYEKSYGNHAGSSNSSNHVKRMWQQQQRIY